MNSQARRLGRAPFGRLARIATERRALEVRMIVPNLIVQDMDSSVRFYRDTHGVSLNITVSPLSSCFAGL